MRFWWTRKDLKGRLEALEEPSNPGWIWAISALVVVIAAVCFLN